MNWRGINKHINLRKLDDSEKASAVALPEDFVRANEPYGVWAVEGNTPNFVSGTKVIVLNSQVISVKYDLKTYYFVPFNHIVAEAS